jgi:short subunit dehydrogenase-like uncharacterized protein
MSSPFLLYGSTGYVGQVAARLASEGGLHPILAGRNALKLEQQAAKLGVEFRVARLDDPQALDQALKGIPVVLHCAGPYLHTSSPMVDACLRNGVHYLDLTGEIPVYEAIAARDAQAKARGVMLLPGVGFDVVPSDCLALHLKQRLPSATRLTLAFHSEDAAGLPPGTQRTSIELIPYGNWVRRNGRLERPEQVQKTRLIDFGKGPILAGRLTWGDVFTAYYSTGIPNIEVYSVLPAAARRLLAAFVTLRPILKTAFMRTILKRFVQPGPSAERRSRTITHVWGEVEDEHGHRSAARLHGPEAGVNWTVLAALAAVKKVLSGSAPAGYQTPAMAYGPDFVLECEGVTRKDLD